MAFSHACYLLQGLFIMRLSDPLTLGLWSSLLLIQNYGMQAHCGLLPAMNQQVPYHAGKGSPAAIQRIQGTVRGNYSIINALFLVPIITAAFIPRMESSLKLGLISIGISTIFAFNLDFYNVLFRSTDRFEKAGSVSVTNSVLMTLGLPLVYFWQFHGLCARAVIVGALSLAFASLRNDLNIGLRFDKEETLRLLRIGVPMVVLNYALVLLYTADRIAIIRFLGSEALGYYQICLAISGSIAVLPTAISQFYYQSMSSTYGGSGTASAVTPIAVKAALLSGAAVTLLSIPLYFALPWLTEALLPKYLPGLPAARIALFSYVIRSFSVSPGYFMVATANKRQQGLLCLLSAAIIFALCGLFTRLGMGLRGVSFAVLAGSITYTLGIWAILVQISSRTPPGQDPQDSPEYL
ncbi:MAG: oligosaccharide flippase family protein [Elusimicrobiota bacterium]